MRFISSMTWVKKGVSKTPVRIKIDENEMKQLFSEMGPNEEECEESESENELDKKDTEDMAEHEDNKSEVENEEENIDKKYNLDNYDNEDCELKLEQLNSLACFPTNAEDVLLTKKDDGEDSDEEDIEIKSSDNLLVCGTVDEDDSSLNIFVYNEDEGNFYIHHDLLLSSVPVCVEWLDFDPTNADSAVNYLAIGTMNPWIEIWDLDLMDSLEPEFTLGSTKKIKKKKLKTELGKKPKIAGHTDAVLDLSYNNLNRNILASASADKTIVLWNLEQMKQATKIKNHKDRVQAIEFHPIEAFSLLSGSCDSTVALYDCRNPKTNKKIWKLENDIERVIWNSLDPNYFLSSDDEGTINLIDIRSDKAVASIKAHDSSVSGLSLSSKVPGLLVSACEDEIVKIWDIKSHNFEKIYEDKLKTGEVTCVESSPDSAFVFSFAGTKCNEPRVWDIREIKEVRERFYERMNINLAEEEKKMEQKISKRKERAIKFKNFKNNKRKFNK
ncbi:periodic tryptophan 1 -like protein [Brachionus plicatilis]|uniref:Periodic tryptophan 1-like protein n=1 Tax=Brachionus plicatilis TaxID=10195 RepID=A0A3M7T4G6_BRAPC|nr:periodic tryptophan 1 -like protein [Brachionus plicatilis]